MKCRLLLADLSRRRDQFRDEIEHLEAAEALARQSQVGDDAWLDVAELLLVALRRGGPSALGAQRAEERAEELLWEARARADRNASLSFRMRVGVLQAQALPEDDAPMSQTMKGP
jgi:hypothetical protein